MSERSSPFSVARWRRGYQGRWLAHDGIAGLSVWALPVPEAMAHASVAGVPVQYRSTCSAVLV